MSAPEQPKFNAFNPHGEVRVYHRNLPHWRQDGATYFVTFRLGDSVPKQILLQWQEEDQLWMQAHGVAVSCTHYKRRGAPFYGGAARKTSG